MNDKIPAATETPCKSQRFAGGRGHDRGVHPAAVGMLLPLLILTGCFSPVSQAERHLQRAVSMLEKSSDPNALAVAGLSHVIRRSSDLGDGYTVAFHLLGRAVALSPNRPDLLWLQIQLCGQVAGCRPEALEERLQVLDPGNGAGWLGALARAYTANDEAALDAAVAAIGHTDRVDLYWTSLAGNLSQALAASHEVSLSIAVVTVIGELSAIAIPAYQPAARACRGERLKRPHALEDCRAFAAAFQHGDTFITALVGSSIAKQVWPVDSTESVAASEARRVGYYRLESCGPDLQSATDASRFVRALLEHRSEQAVCREELLIHHKSVDPAPDWVQRVPQ